MILLELAQPAHHGAVVVQPRVAVLVELPPQTRRLLGLLDKLVGDVRLKAENMRRVAALDAAGFGALAESLATLNADPKALKSALDQLAAGGTAAYRSAQVTTSSPAAQVMVSSTPP